jgi:subtilisin family serine protease
LKTLGRLSRFSKRTLQTQSPGIWGLGRISHHANSISSYIYDSTAGQNTCVYVIDSGINTAHVEFGGRATSVTNWVTAESISDLSGHGTAVAGTVGATTYGVAKLTKLYSMKVCDQSGNCAVSSVVAAISASINDSATRSCTNGVVINLSLGGVSAGWQSVSQAVVTATQAGVFVVSAAGNDGANAANYLPASAPGSCTVGATDVNDAKPSWSNWGSKLAVFAPGVNVQSTYIGSTTATVSTASKKILSSTLLILNIGVL